MGGYLFLPELDADLKNRDAEYPFSIAILRHRKFQQMYLPNSGSINWNPITNVKTTWIQQANWQKMCAQNLRTASKQKWLGKKYLKTGFRLFLPQESLLHQLSFCTTSYRSPLHHKVFTGTTFYIIKLHPAPLQQHLLHDKAAFTQDLFHYEHFWHPKRILRRDAHPTRIKSSVATFNALPSFVRPMRMKPQKGLAASASYNSVTSPTCTKAVSLPRGQRVPLGPTQKKAAQVSLCCRPSLQSKEPFERASRNDSVDAKNVSCLRGLHSFKIFDFSKVSDPTLSSIAWEQVFSIKQVASNPLGSQPAFEENRGRS